MIGITNTKDNVHIVVSDEHSSYIGGYYKIKKTNTCGEDIIASGTLEKSFTLNIPVDGEYTITVQKSKYPNVSIDFFVYFNLYNNIYENLQESVCNFCKDCQDAEFLPIFTVSLIQTFINDSCIAFSYTKHKFSNVLKKKERLSSKTYLKNYILEFILTVFLEMHSDIENNNESTLDLEKMKDCLSEKEIYIDDIVENIKNYCPC